MNRIGCVRGGIVVESEVFDGVCVDGYSDIIFLTQIWFNGKGIFGVFVGSRFQCSGCGTCNVKVSGLKPGDFFGESDGDVESDVFLNRWYTGNVCNRWNDSVNVNGIGYT